jgi:hypothetical protein
MTGEEVYFRSDNKIIEKLFNNEQKYLPPQLTLMSQTALSGGVEITPATIGIREVAR